MKIKSLNILAAVLLIGLSAFALVSFKSGEKEPWTQGQLLDPDDLASTIGTPQSYQPMVISIGPGAVIKNSIEIGPTREARNLDKLRDRLKDISTEETIVLYCGCCPFDKCPNIRPAFELLNQMQFKNHKLLNLPHNIKMDWIDHGYPVAD